MQAISTKMDENRFQNTDQRDNPSSYRQERWLFGRRIKVLSLFLLMKLPYKKYDETDVLKTAVMRIYLKKSTAWHYIENIK